MTAITTTTHHSNPPKEDPGPFEQSSEPAGMTVLRHHTSFLEGDQKKHRSNANLRLAWESRGLFLGPMPTQTFLDKFLPHDPGAPVCPDPGECFARLGGSENGNHELFVAAVTPFAPKLTLFNINDKPDMDRDGLNPDICVYPIDDPPDGGKTDFSKMDLFVELKSEKSYDPFVREDSAADEEFPFEKCAKASQLNRGQLASYAAALAGTQFRIHTFCVLMCAGDVRFIRWDRSGAVVTDLFNCAQKPHFLAQFFWRYSHLNLERKGYDTSVSPVPRAVPQHILDDWKEFRIFKVPDRENPEEEKDFVVWLRAKYTARSPFGRGTRPMLAYDMEKKGIVFLKDYWRADGADKEGDIYSLLESKDVPNIPPFGKGNDVRNHATVTDVLKTEDATGGWALPSKEMGSYRHYRMTLNVVGRPLTSFRSSREFVRAIADAMEAHDHAYFDAHVLHRDISSGNIIITDDDEGKGLLIDWDLCVRVDPDSGKRLTPRRRPDRTGTWPFMSVALLQDNTKANELEDDRESCLHVLTWMALCFTKHTIKDGNLKEFLMPFDEAYEVDDGVKGGNLKRYSLVSGDIPKRVRFKDRRHLDDLIKELTNAFAPRYFEDLSESDLEPEVSKVIEKYKIKKKETLKEQGWLVKIFKRHLDAGSWPASDKAVKQSTNGKTNGETDGPPMKRIRTSEVGGVGSGLHGGVASSRSRTE